MQTVPTPPKRLRAEDLRKLKGTTPIVSLTAYTASMAERLDKHAELLLVGDSLAMTIYGLDSTVGISLDTMIAHGAAVVRGSKRACIVIDLPAGTYEESADLAVETARRAVEETGAEGVKLEGGTAMAAQIAAIVEAGIPVLGHIGLLPQHAKGPGGFRVQGRDDDAFQAILEDAKAVEAAGAFATVAEATVEPLARAITEAISIPTIGIGASAACDGQILVVDDILGLYSAFKPKFVKRYADLGDAIEKAAADYAADVRARRFPGPDHVYGDGPGAAAKDEKVNGKTGGAL